MNRLAVVGAFLALVLSGCGGGSSNGPSRDALFGACLDGGWKATRPYGLPERQSARAVCECVVDLFQSERRRFDEGAAERLLMHWQQQSNQSIGLDLFPTSVSSDPAFVKPGYAGRCQIEFR